MQYAHLGLIAGLGLAAAAPLADPSTDVKPRVNQTATVPFQLLVVGYSPSPVDSLTEPYHVGAGVSALTVVPKGQTTDGNGAPTSGVGETLVLQGIQHGNDTLHGRIKQVGSNIPSYLGFDRGLLQELGTAPLMLSVDFDPNGWHFGPDGSLKLNAFPNLVHYDCLNRTMGGGYLVPNALYVVKPDHAPPRGFCARVRLLYGPPPVANPEANWPPQSAGTELATSTSLTPIAAMKAER